MRHNLFNSLQPFTTAAEPTASFYSLPQLEREGVGPISRLPVSIRVVLESVLRNFDGKRIRESDVRALANWEPHGERTAEIPFIVSRVLLQDFTGVPLLVDLAAMRSCVARLGQDPGLIEPLVPVHLVVDHSLQIDFSARDAVRLNMEMEVRRNLSRYRFLKWGTQAFENFSVIPPGIGICHQVNLEYLAQGILERDGLYYPDTLVGTDSHTTMINGLGILGWGVGGIEAESGMLGQPVHFLMPDVVGVNLTGKLREGVTATDVVLYVTQMLRRANVVGKFVEFHGAGAASLSVPDRATIANMAPEYGATIGFFPVDEETCRYLLATGRSARHVENFRNYFKAQGMFGIARAGEHAYSTVIEMSLEEIKPSVSGPRRPQDRIELNRLKDTFNELLQKPTGENGYRKSPDEVATRFPTQAGIGKGEAIPPLSGGGRQEAETMPRGDGLVSEKNTSILTEREMINNRPTPDNLTTLIEHERAEQIFPREFPPRSMDVGHGDVLIASITSCTNTSNPGVMLAAGLLARNAVRRGLQVRPGIKTSLAPGSRAVSDYFTRTGLQPFLDQLGFNLVGYGCTACVGLIGPLDPHLEETVVKNDVIAASVLSGNRNFEARIHQSVKANFLMSPPLVVAFALAGRINIDMTTEPLGTGRDGEEIFLRDIWPSLEEVRELMSAAFDPETYRRLYDDFAAHSPLWNQIPSNSGQVYEWDVTSTYIQEPPYFEKFGVVPEKPTDICGARALAIFGDSVTTDHISPAGSIKPSSPAGLYLNERGVGVEDFNSYGSRRGNHQVMIPGTFANVRLRNLMVPGTEGGVTAHQPHGERMSIYDASLKYQAAGVPLVVIAGQEYGSGSSRDWAAKGTRLLGVRAVVAESFERIHRSNLIGMGVLPCQFPAGLSAATLRLDGTETFDILGLDDEIVPRQEVTLVVRRAGGEKQEVNVRLRIDTLIEAEHYRHGGILPYVLRQLLAAA